MEELIMQLVESQGIWAVLFVFLLLYTIKKNDRLEKLQETREEKYQLLLSELTNKFSVVNNINEKIDEIIESVNTTKNRE